MVCLDAPCQYVKVRFSSFITFKQQVDCKYLFFYVLFIKQDFVVQVLTNQNDNKQDCPPLKYSCIL